MFNILVLFLAPLLSGLLIYLVPDPRRKTFSLLLVFAGSYLFSITVVHILPHLYHETTTVALTGLFVLAGFFLQQFLEFFTSGIEHGHMHAHAHHHEQREVSALILLAAMCLHAFLEGGILVPKGPEPGNTGPVLLGIVLHRAPAAFALMAVLTAQLHGRGRALPHLIGFSLAGPAGLALGDYLAGEELLTPGILDAIYAVVSGSFLYISTTIFIESSPEHRFNARRLAVAIAAALVAVLVEYVL